MGEGGSWMRFNLWCCFLQKAATAQHTPRESLSAARPQPLGLSPPGLCAPAHCRLGQGFTLTLLLWTLFPPPCVLRLDSAHCPRVHAVRTPGPLQSMASLARSGCAPCACGPGAWCDAFSQRLPEGAHDPTSASLLGRGHRFYPVDASPKLTGLAPGRMAAAWSGVDGIRST